MARARHRPTFSAIAWRRERVLILLVAGIVGAAASATPVFAQPEIACVGDLNGDGQVTVNEILIGVNIALGSVPLSAGPSFDADGDGQVTIDELLRAINGALSGCAPTEPDLHGADAVKAGSRDALTTVGATDILDFGLVHNTTSSSPARIQRLRGLRKAEGMVLGTSAGATPTAEACTNGVILDADWFRSRFRQSRWLGLLALVPACGLREIGRSEGQDSGENSGA